MGLVIRLVGALTSMYAIFVFIGGDSAKASYFAVLALTNLYSADYWEKTNARKK